ncbi:MAG TPA: MarR family transcriptional regulator [Roseomonas sp.]
MTEPSGPVTAPPFDDGSYAALAAFRRSLRVFLAFSEQAAIRAGLTPQQHQAILAIRGFATGRGVAIGDLAAHLLLKHHTAVGLVDRLEKAGMVERVTDATDRRRVLLRLTPKAEAVLAALSVTHLAEIRQNAPDLIALLRELSEDADAPTG